MHAGILFAGDLHLSPATYVSHPQMRGDSMFALDQITGYCLKNELTLCLLGDNFDKRFPDPATIFSFLNSVKGIDLLYIVGQHDRHGAVQWPEIEPDSSNFRVHLGNGELDKECFRVGDFNLWGFDNSPRARVEEQLKLMPADCDILCVHQLFPQVMGLDGQWTMDLTLVPVAEDGGPRYILAGDWHGLPLDGTTDGRRWLYTGSSSMRSISEPADKSFVVLKRSADKDDLQRVPLLTRPFLYYEARYEKELTDVCSSLMSQCLEEFSKAIAAGVPEEVAVPLVAFRYDVNLPNANSLIESAVAGEDGKKLHLRRLPVRTSDDTGVDETVLRVSVQDAIDELVDKQIAPELHAFTSELAVSSDARESVQAYKRRHYILDDPFCG